LASFTKLRKNLLIVFYLNSIIFTYTCLHDETKINDPENSTFILQDLNLVFKYITEFYFWKLSWKLERKIFFQIKLRAIIIKEIKERKKIKNGSKSNYYS
jgi:hypothetical protein